MRKTVLVLCLLILMATPVGAEKFKVRIHNPNDYALTEYQVRIDLSGYLSSPQYLKVTDSSGKLLKFTYEQPNGECGVNPTTVIWVKVPYIPANGGTTIYVETSDINYAVKGDQVFDFYDDFSMNDLGTKWTIVSGKWKIRNGYLHGMYLGTTTEPMGRVKSYFNDKGNFIYEWKAKFITYISNQYPWCGIIIKSKSQDYYKYDSGYMLLPYTNTGCPVASNVVKIWRCDNGKITLLQKSTYWIADNQFYTWCAKYHNGIIEICSPNSEVIVSAIDYTYKKGSTLRLCYAETFGDVYFDWIRVRKYADIEPTVTIEAETQGSIKPTVERNLPSAVKPDEMFYVTLVVSGVDYGTIIEDLPQGFYYMDKYEVIPSELSSNIQVISLQPANNAVKIILNDVPKRQIVKIRYAVSASSKEGKYTFSGVVKDSEGNVITSVGGDNTITVTKSGYKPSYKQSGNKNGPGFEVFTAILAIALILTLKARKRR